MPSSLVAPRGSVKHPQTGTRAAEKSGGTPGITRRERKSPRAATRGLCGLRGAEVELPLSLLRVGFGGLVRLGSGPWGRADYPIVLQNNVLLGRKHGVSGAAAVVAAVVAAMAAAAAHVVAVAVARVPAVGRVGVEIAPIALAATTSAPVTGRKQGEQATQRTTVPRAAVAAIAAGIPAWIAAAVGVDSGAPGSACRPADRSAPWPASQLATIVASVAGESGATIAAHGARAITKDPLEQTAAGGRRQHTSQQTEEHDPFHDILPLLLNRSNRPSTDVIGRIIGRIEKIVRTENIGDVALAYLDCPSCRSGILPLPGRPHFSPHGANPMQCARH